MLCIYYQLHYGMNKYSKQYLQILLNHLRLRFKKYMILQYTYYKDYRNDNIKKRQTDDTKIKNNYIYARLLLIINSE